MCTRTIPCCVGFSSPLVPLIFNVSIHKRCVWVSPLGLGLRSAFTADDTKLGSYHRRLQVGVKTVRVSSSRQGLGLARHAKKLGLRRLGLAPVALGLRIGLWVAAGGAQATQKAVRPETG